MKERGIERERERVADFSQVHHSIETVRIGYTRNKKKRKVEIE